MIRWKGEGIHKRCGQNKGNRKNKVHNFKGERNVEMNRGVFSFSYHFNGHHLFSKSEFILFSFTKVLNLIQSQKDNLLVY